MSKTKDELKIELLSALAQVQANEQQLAEDPVSASRLEMAIRYEAERKLLEFILENWNHKYLLAFDANAYSLANLPPNKL